jgi:serine/threonine protein kinase
MIGQGSFGTVYMGLNTANGKLMAIKQVQLLNSEKKHQDPLEEVIANLVGGD